jgi:hypothetical protein
MTDINHQPELNDKRQNEMNEWSLEIQRHACKQRMHERTTALARPKASPISASSILFPDGRASALRARDCPRVIPAFVLRLTRASVSVCVPELWICMSGTLDGGQGDEQGRNQGRSRTNCNGFEVHGRRFVTTRVSRSTGPQAEHEFRLHHCSPPHPPFRQQAQLTIQPMQSGSIVYAYVALGAQAVLPIVLGSFASVKVRSVSAFFNHEASTECGIVDS